MAGWEEIIKLALPAVAGFYAGHKGQLGPYSQGYLQSQQIVDRSNLQRQQMEDQQLYRSEQLRRQDIDDQRQQQSLEMQMADRERNDVRQQQALESQLAQRDLMAQAQQAEAERKEKERQTALVQKHLEAAGQDYETSAMIQKLGKESFSIDVPGIGPINLQRAIEMGAVPPANFGTATPPPPKQPALITTPGPDGKPVRGIDAPGAPVYERPQNSPEALGVIPGPGGKPIYGPKVAGAPVYERPRAIDTTPKSPVRRSFTWKDDDPDSETFGQTFRIVEDENGNEISKTRLTGTSSKAKPNAPVGGVKIKSITPIP